MQDEVIKRIIRIFIVIFITVLVATLIALLILKYNVEGEDNMPFELSKILVISTAKGEDTQDIQIEKSEVIRNLKIIQNNDVYLEIKKNKNYKETEIIDKIIIDNLKVEKEPKVGTVKMYKPTEDGASPYNNIEENEIKEILEYTGKEKADIKNLEVTNQGALVLFRYAIEDLGTYTANDNAVKQDGTILSTQELDYKDIQCKVSFDLSIKLKSDMIYTGTIILDLPAGNIIEEGTSHYERTNLKDIIFRRNLR